MIEKDHNVRLLTDGEVENIAVDWRRKLNRFFITNSLDVRALFEAVGESIRWPIKLSPMRDTDMGDANAYVSEDRQTVFMRSSLVAAAAAGNADAIFDAVHELGHIVLHRLPVRMARMAERIEKVSFLNPDDSAEHQANYFTRAFLMLAEEVAIYRYPEDLSSHCNTPLSQAAKRLIEISRLPVAKVLRDAKVESAWLHARTIPGEAPEKFRLSRGGFKAQRGQHMRPSHHYGWYEEFGAVVTYIESQTD